MRGQLSLEYLVLSLVALSLLSISISALIEIKKSAEQNLEVINFKSSTISLSNAIDELCALGDGNGREIILQNTVSIDSEFSDPNWVVRFSDQNSTVSLVRRSICSVDASEVKGKVYVKNEDGTIKIRER